MSEPVLSFNERRRFKHRIQKLLHLSSRKGDSNKTAGPFFEKIEYPKPTKEKLIVLFGVLVFGVLTVLATSHVYTNYKHNQDIKKLGGVKPTTQIATAKQEEKRYKKANDKNLANGDIESYQVTNLSVVNGYLQQKDFKNAQRVLDEIKDNIPKDKLQIGFYIYQLQVDEHDNDKLAQKTDLTALIALLKAVKSDYQAAIYQQQLDGFNGVKKSETKPTTNTAPPLTN